MDIQRIIGGQPVGIDPAEINGKPGPFCMSFGFNMVPLVQSIESIGLINPPLICRQREGRVVIITGYRRALAVKSLKWAELPCRDLTEEDFSDLDLLRINLRDNLPTRRFNDVEKGMVLSRLKPSVPDDDIINKYMPLLGLSSNARILEALLQIEAMNDHEKNIIAKGKLSLFTLQSLSRMTNESRIEVMKWINKLMLNFNQQKQFIEYISDMAIKKGVSLPELLQEDELANLLDQKTENIPQKAKGVMGVLRRRRFPMLTRAEERYRKTLSELHLPPGTRIAPPPYFEGQNYRLEVVFRSGRKLQELLESLCRIRGLEKLTDDEKGRG